MKIKEKINTKENIKESKKEENKQITKNKNFFNAMEHALDGVIHAFKTERNLRIDYLMGLAILLISLFFDFTKTEMICLLLTIGFVIFSEMINSTVEYVVDLITTEYNENAKYAKDIAAGGVLISSSISVIVAYFLYGDKISGAAKTLLNNVLNSKAHLLVTILFAIVLLTVIIKAIVSKKDEKYLEVFPSSRVAVSFGLAIYLYIITNSFLVGGTALALALIVANLKRQKDGNSIFHLVLSALLGILIVLCIYQISLANLDFNFLNFNFSEILN